VAVSFIDGGNRSTRRKPPTCRMTDKLYHMSEWDSYSQLFFKTNSSIVAILELIRGAQCLIEVIQSSGEEM
jgi:hypothetical protein